MNYSTISNVLRRATVGLTSAIRNGCSGFARASRTQCSASVCSKIASCGQIRRRYAWSSATGVGFVGAASGCCCVVVIKWEASHLKEKSDIAVDATAWRKTASSGVCGSVQAGSLRRLSAEGGGRLQGVGGGMLWRWEHNGNFLFSIF